MLYTLLDKQTKIHPVHLMAAIAVWDYCERSVRFLFGDRTGNPLSDDVRKVLLAAREQGMTRDELRNYFMRNRSSEELTRTLSTLESAGLAKRESVSTGGRPAERWYAVVTEGTGSQLIETARRIYAVNAESLPSDTPLPRLSRLPRTGEEEEEVNSRSATETPLPSKPRRRLRSDDRPEILRDGGQS